jgi:hypothetical protein
MMAFFNEWKLSDRGMLIQKNNVSGRLLLPSTTSSCDKEMGLPQATYDPGQAASRMA